MNNIDAESISKIVSYRIHQATKNRRANAVWEHIKCNCEPGASIKLWVLNHVSGCLGITVSDILGIQNCPQGLNMRCGRDSQVTIMRILRDYPGYTAALLHEYFLNKKDVDAHAMSPELWYKNIANE